MKISIVTINYNNAKGLEKTIHSVTSQTYFDKVEYVIIDGGSTDGSKELIEQNKDKISYWCSEHDKGIYNAMNKGVSHSNGEYMLFINSGDMLFAPTSIERIYNKLDADIVYGDLCVIYNARNKAFIKEYPAIINEEYMKNESLPHPSSFIKRNLLERYKYNENFKIISDWAFFYEQILLNRCSYKHVHEIVSVFYLGGVSSNTSLINEEKKVFYEEINPSPEITVIMPCYNYAHYIGETINSLKNSTYKNWNCIIVNDGSTDDSENVIFNLIKDDKRFVYIKQPNKGLSGARNIGIRASNTKYILCLDPDDKISPTYIENGIKHLNTHEEDILYYGKAKLFYDDGTEKDWKLPKYSYGQLIYSNCIYSSFIYRKKDYERIGGYDENLKGYEDWDFLIRLLSDDKKVYMADDIVFYYRRHDGSMDSIAKKNYQIYKEYILNKNSEAILKTLKMIKNNK